MVGIITFVYRDYIALLEYRRKNDAEPTSDAEADKLKAEAAEIDEVLSDADSRDGSGR